MEDGVEDGAEESHGRSVEGRVMGRVMGRRSTWMVAEVQCRRPRRIRLFQGLGSGWV